MKYFNLVIILVAAVYIIQIIRFYAGLLRLKPGKNRQLYSISVIVPARNEEQNIRRCLLSLLNQDYSRHLFKIYVVDDNSSDRTAAVVESIQQQHPHRIELFRLQDLPKSKSLLRYQAYKKAAIQYGIENSSGDIIFTIDADCWAQPTWLSATIRHFNENTGMVSGYILYNTKKQNLFVKIQSLEFLGLVTAGAGSIGLGEPVVSNGANLAYRRTAFEQVNGFKDIDQLPSGDDDLLMQKIHKQKKWEIRFAIEQTAHNYTEAVSSLPDFINQRTRWASKSTHYHNRLLVFFMTLVYLFYVYLFAGSFYSIITGLSYPLPLILFASKAAAEWLVVQKGCKLTKRMDLMKIFPLAQLFQVGYIIWVGLFGTFGRYEWKGRKTINFFGAEKRKNIKQTTEKPI